MEISEKFKTTAKLNAFGLIPMTFGSPDAFFKTLIADRQFWSDLPSKASATLGNDPQVNPAIQHIRGSIEQTIERFQQVASANGSEEQFKSVVAEYGSRNILPSDSAPARFILKLSEGDPLQALRVAICCHDVQVALGQTRWGSKWARAGGLAEILLRGWLKNVEGLDGALSEFSASWDARFTAIDGDLNRRLSELSKSSSQMSSLVDTATVEVRDLVTNIREMFDKEITSGHEQIAAVKETYKAELTLQAPTTYWRAKQVAHRATAGGWAIGFLGAAALAAWAVWQVWSVTAAPYLGDKIPPSYGYFLPVIGTGFLMVWILRIISRQLIANLALSSDSGERVAMVKTFLALMQKPEHVKEPDRVLILSALFRPTVSQGDDGAPPSWFDLVMQRIGPKQ